MIGHRFGHQSGEHESSEQNSAAILNGFSLRVDLVVSEICKNTKTPSRCNIIESTHYNTSGMISMWKELVNRYPIISIEDPLDENDFIGFSELTNEIGESIQIVGDDLFATNSKRLLKGIEEKAGNAILIKVNQIGTLTETLDAIKLSKKAGFGTVISHRSGETEDHLISDLSVACNSGQIKAGSLSRSDRLSKYNQLLRIEEELSSDAIFKGNILK